MAKGATLLKVVGIIMIVFGAIGIIIALLAFAGSAILDSVGVKAGVYYFASVVALLSAALELGTGILGVVNNNKPEKAQVCLICAIAIIALSFLGNFILPLIAGTGIGWFSFIIGLILPGLFIFGAIQNKNS